MLTAGLVLVFSQLTPPRREPWSKKHKHVTKDCEKRGQVRLGTSEARTLGNGRFLEVMGVRTLGAEDDTLATGHGARVEG